MWRAKISNHAFERMGERYAHLIDPDHFLGRTAFDFPWRKESMPAANVIKKGNVFELQLLVPGYSKEEIEIVVEDDILKVRGEKNKSGQTQESEEFILEEFDFDSFERCFKLSPKITHDKITAKYENGILTLAFEDIPVEEKKTHTKIAVG